MKKLVCITGLPGAGKSIVADWFVEKDFQFIRFGQITLDVIKEKGLEVNEKNEKKIRESFRKKHGMAAFAVLNLPKFKKLLKKGNVIADGLYSFEEYKFLKEKFAKQMVLIAVYAPPSLRHQRISKRKISQSDRKLRNRPFTKKEAAGRDETQLANLNMGPSIAMADYTVLNTKDKKFLHSQLKEILRHLCSLKLD